MKFLKLSAVLAAFTIGSTSAFAFTSYGNIEDINARAKTIRLRNGDSYRLPHHLDILGLMVGQRVAVTWDTQNPNSIEIGKDKR